VSERLQVRKRCPVTLRRSVKVGLVGIALAAIAGTGIVLAGTWVQIGGKWFYTPDVGTELTLKGVPNPETNPSQVRWTLTATRFAVACRNNGGNFASFVVSVVPASVSEITNISPGDIIDKNQGIAVVPGHIDTDPLAFEPSIICQNPQWTVDPTTVLAYTFNATSDVYALNKKTGLYEFQNRKNYSCDLSDASATPINPPAPGAPYNCF
jgi:hypothetical protein